MTIDHRGIEKVFIENFRSIRELELELDPQLTVFFGLNASGKTTIYDALRTLLGNVLKKFGHGVAAGAADLRKERSGLLADYLRVEALAWDGVYRSSLEQPEVARPPSRMIGLDGKRWQDARKALAAFADQDPAPRVDWLADATWLPVVAAYPASRGQLQSSESKGKTTEPDRLDGFKGALMGSANFTDVVEWFDLEEDFERRQKITRDDLKFRTPSLEWVRQAVRDAGHGVSNPRTEVKPSRMVVDFDRDDGGPPEVLDMRQLSDGYRALFGLVLDLARRMAQVNPTANLAHPYKGTRSPAVVLVDEIDLHLHPTWQGQVLPSLMKAFPNTQWIVTTHSEQVIASVDKQHVRELVHDGTDLHVLPVPFAQGATSERILTDLMHVPERVPGPVATDLREYLKLVALDQGRSERALELRGKLEDAIGGDPLLQRVDLRLRGFKSPADDAA